MSGTVYKYDDLEPLLLELVGRADILTRTASVEAQLVQIDRLIVWLTGAGVEDFIEALEHREIHQAIDVAVRMAIVVKLRRIRAGERLEIPA